MPKVLFIGDINVDVIMGGMAAPPTLDREVPCQSFEIVMGASTVLCACAYASLGGTAAFAGLAGQDDYGDFMVRGLQDFGIDTSFVRRTSDVKTGVTVNLIYENTRTQVTYPGTIAEFDGSGIDLSGFDHLHFAGVYLETRLRPRLAAILEEARRRGLTASLDPQWDSTERWEFMEEWIPRLTYLFVNDGEAMSVTREASPEGACRKLAECGCLPLVKAGKDGAFIPLDGEVRRVPGFPVEVVDTTGAGDSFDAGFLFARLEKRLDLLEAARFANAVAARSCMFVGGVAARSSYRDVMEFLGRR
jgi:sugar/nucleoside kinase (ribokinase family)